VPNPSYQPTDPGRMVQQLQQQASAQQQTLQQQVQSGKLTSDQAASQFDQWWNTNVEPMKGDIANLQATQQADLAQKQAYANYYAQLPGYNQAQLAETAANNAQSNYLRAIPYMANPNAASLAQQALSGGKYNPAAAIQAMTFSGPSLQEIGRQGAAAALAHISPTAQSIVQQGQGAPIGQPAAPGLPNLNQLLNQSQYGFGGATPGGAPGSVAGPSTNVPGTMNMGLAPNTSIASIPLTNMQGAPGVNLMTTSQLSGMGGPGAGPPSGQSAGYPGYTGGIPPWDPTYMAQPYAYGGLSGAYDAGSWGRALPGYGQ